jgi:competence protein ComEC
MHFAGTEFDLLTMADSGERAQQRIARHLGNWATRKSPLILKVSHHGSADQYAELTEALKPSFSIVSVGAKNGYGHPTDRTLALLRRVGSKVLRTDLLGSIAIDTSTSAEGQITVKLLASG